MQLEYRGAHGEPYTSFSSWLIITSVRSVLTPGRVRVLAVRVDLPQSSGTGRRDETSACPAPVLYACDVTPDERAVVVREDVRRGAAGRPRDPCTVSERPDYRA